MERSVKKEKKPGDNTKALTWDKDTTDDFVRMLARRKLTAKSSDFCGMSRIYDISSGWEIKILFDDPAVMKAETLADFEAYMSDSEIYTILIPASSSITKSAAQDICRRSGLSKTVFFEVQDA